MKTESSGGRETPDQSQRPPGQLRALIEHVRSELGDSTGDLIRQAVADLSTLDRQNRRNHFEGRLEYARQVHEHRQAALRGIVDYGLQTMKWMFLLNAGAIRAGGVSLRQRRSQ